MIGAFFFILGLIIGSFLNVCIYRIPHNISIIKGRSFCPICKNKIKFYDNIPIISYILLKGKCRYCGAPISIQYPVVELIIGIFSLALFIKYSLSYKYIFYFIFVSSLTVLSVIDISHQIIPDVITIPGMILGILYSVLDELGLFRAILGLLLGGGLLLLISLLYSSVRGREGMGGGDIKLMGMIGAWLGPRCIFPVIMIASVLGIVIGSFFLMMGKEGLKKPIPFGPFLSFGALLYLFVPQISFLSPF